MSYPGNINLMNRTFLIFLFFIFLFFMNSCSDRAEDIRVFESLSSWDKIIDYRAKDVSDSLKTINYESLNRNNKAYYNLLKVISDDKTYVNFASDSLISSVVNFYRSHDPKSPNLIRSLAYLGIVRTRMGVNDSTVYEPLREADKLLASMPYPNPSLGYMINFFLGNIHYNNRNYPIANDYFLRTLGYAREERDSIHIFDTYLAIYWNSMQSKDFGKGRIYLDTLSSFYNKFSSKDYYILNAQSIYYDIMDEPKIALEKEKAKLLLVRLQEESVDLSKLYFNISDRFVGLEQLDSAMVYAQMAIDINNDSAYVYNHLYFENVANIAEKQGNYEYANRYRKKASELYKKSVSERLDTQIAEMEKKYDLSEAENVILRTKQQSSRIIIVSLIVMLVVAVVMMYLLKARKESRMKLMQAENRVQQQEMQAELMEREENKRKWLLLLYSNISDRLTFLQGEFEKLTQRYVSSNPKVYKEMQLILKNTDTDLRDINKTLAPNDETFFAYTHLKDNYEILNANEKMLLMLLACDADNRQLATFLNTTTESIRVRKSQLKKKMIENGYDIEVFGD